MLRNLSRDVSVIEGVGPKTAARLSAVGVETLLDFVALPAADYHEALDGAASLAEIERWQAMAFTMQVDAVDGQFAEALARAEYGLLELAMTSLADLRGVFERARAARKIPNVPETEILVDMIREAALLSASRCLLGKLVDADGQPVVGATVRVSQRATVSNANGLFKLAGLLDESDKLIVEYDDQRYRLAGYALLRDADDTGFERFSLDEHARVEAKVLSELDGDALPPMRGWAVVTRHHVGEALRDGDVLRVRRLYADGEDAKLHSIFNSFDGSAFVTHTYRVGLDTIAEPVVVGDHLMHHGGGFSKVDLDRDDWAAWKRLKVFQRDHAAPEPGDGDAVTRYLDAMLEHLSNDG